MDGGRKKRSMCEETIREEYQQTPAKRRRRWLLDRIRDVQQRHTTAESMDDTPYPIDAWSFQQDGAPKYAGANDDNEDFLEENKLLQLYYAMEQELMEEELEYLESREQDENDALLLQQVEDYEKSKGECTTTAACPLCNEGRLVEECDCGKIAVACHSCGLQIHDSTLASFCEKIRDAMDLHTEVCQVALQMEQHGNIVEATCEVCQTRLCIV